MPRTASPKSTTKPTAKSTPRSKKAAPVNDVPVLEVVDATAEPEPEPTQALGYDAADFDLSPDELSAAVEEADQAGEPFEDTLARHEQAHAEARVRQRSVPAKRTVMSKGSPKADKQYALKRLREAVWYRLRHAFNYAIAQANKKTDGFKLDTVFDDEIVRVTYRIASMPLDKMSEQAYAAAQDTVARMVDEYETKLQSVGFVTEHTSVDGTPYVSIALVDNPVTQPDD